MNEIISGNCKQRKEDIERNQTKNKKIRKEAGNAEIRRLMKLSLAQGYF